MALGNDALELYSGTAQQEVVSNPEGPIDKVQSQQQSVPSKRPSDADVDSSSKRPKTASEDGEYHSDLLTSSRTEAKDNSEHEIEHGEEGSGEITSPGLANGAAGATSTTEGAGQAEEGEESVTGQEEDADGNDNQEPEEEGEEEEEEEEEEDDDDDDDPDIFIWEDSKWSKDSPHIKTPQQKKSEAMQSKVDLARQRVDFEDRAKAGDIYAAAYLEVIKRFEEIDKAREEVVKDPDLSNPLDVHAPFRTEPSIDDDQHDDRAWFDEETLTNMVLLHRNGMIAEAYYCDPAKMYLWLSTHLVIDHVDYRVKKIKAAIKALQEDSAMPAIERANLPGADISATTEFLVVPFNVRHHWVGVKIKPDFQTKKGKIIVYNSMQSQRALNLVKDIFPYLARLIDMQSHVGWNQTSWKVCSGESTQQRNGVDCGPITASNCIQLLKGQEPIVHTGNDMINAFGAQLRYEFLQGLFGEFCNVPFPRTASVSGGASGSSSAVGNRAGGKAGPKSFGGPKGEGAKSGESTSSIKGYPNKAGSTLQSNKGSDHKLDDQSNVKSPETGLRALNADSVNYRELLCNALLEYGPLTTEELEAEVTQKLGDRLDLDDGLAERLALLLDETSFMFQQDGDRWQVLSGLGRSVDSTTKERLLNWQPPASAVEVQREQQLTWDLALGIVRTSPTIRRSDAFDKDHQRCEELVQRYCNDFHDGRMPPKMAKDPLTGVWTQRKPGWYPYSREMRSSQTNLFEGASRRDLEVRSLLTTMNRSAGREGQRYTVLLIGNGWDGLTTNNSGWSSLGQKWSNLNFDLAIALPRNVVPSGLFEGEPDGPTWARYSYSTLVELLSTETSRPTQNSPITPAFHELTAEDTVSHEIQASRRIHHEQFLFFCQSMNAKKLDHSISESDTMVIIKPDSNNPLAAALTQCNRNRFDLNGTLPALQCMYCGHPYKRCLDLMGHLDREHPEGDLPDDPRAFQCLYPGCTRRFESQRGVKIHTAMAHGEESHSPQTVQCTYPGCDRTFDSKLGLGMHVAQVHREELESAESIMCWHPGCDRAFETNRKLKKHIVDQHPEYMEENSKEAAKFPCPYPNCMEWSSNQSGITRHIKTSHPESELQKFYCSHPDCVKNYADKYSLRKHIRDKHPTHQLGDPEDFKCGYLGCVRTFSNQSALTRHIGQAHLHEEMTEHGFEPGLEPDSGLHGGPVQRLERRDQDSPKVVCPRLGCDRIFADSREVADHISESHQGDKQKVTCPHVDCRRNFQSRSGLVAHIGAVHGGDDLDETRNMACPRNGCDRKYKRLQDLTRHIRKEHREQERVLLNEVQKYSRRPVWTMPRAITDMLTRLPSSRYYPHVFDPQRMVELLNSINLPVLSAQTQREEVEDGDQEPDEVEDEDEVGPSH